MTVQQSTAIRAVLATAPIAALRRVVRQPLRLWKAGGTDGEKRCVMEALCGLRGTYADHPPLLWTPPSDLACAAAMDFNRACAADGLRETVRRVKAWARELLRERGGG